ncbi:Protein phosphatase 2C-like protein [Euroglyphus maynei]|uniref:Protein phosphatase 2C-like protein n=1 Tax=Euroglyphus maynei TaxID=6958 RepID=A0A1Y3BPR7_EURMA|nr:Protein phosphatase 2C-like protein [Euroglyphus maynei]
MCSPFRSTCSTKIQTENGRCSRFEFAVACCQGWRRTQEDAHLVIADLERNTSIFAVLDGHNGPEVAKFIAEYLPKHLLKNRNYRRGNIERGLQESFMALDELLITKEANELLLGQYRDRRPSLPHLEMDEPLAYFVGCTAVVLLVKNDIYYCANIGDSRCLVGRPNGGRLIAHQLSFDHKPSVPEERSRVEQAGGTIINGRINGSIDITRAFGDHNFKLNKQINRKQQMIIAWPHTTVEKINEDDRFIVLICDGIWNAISNQDLIEYIGRCMNEKMPLNHICESVIQRILPVNSMPKQGIAGKDNMTIMIIKKLPWNFNQTPFESVTQQQSTSSQTPNNRRGGERSMSSVSSHNSTPSKIMFSQDLIRRL